MGLPLFPFTPFFAPLFCLTCRMPLCVHRSGPAAPSVRKPPAPRAVPRGTFGPPGRKHRSLPGAVLFLFNQTQNRPENADLQFSGRFLFAEKEARPRRRRASKNSAGGQAGKHCLSPPQAGKRKFSRRAGKTRRRTGQAVENQRSRISIQYPSGSLMKYKSISWFS